MLRSILKHSPSSSSLLKLTHATTPISRIGTVADILAILGPLEASPDASTATGRCVRLLRRCIRLNASPVGRSVHAHLLKLGSADDVRVWNVMLDFYAKAGLLSNCADLFDEMPERDIVSWSTLMSGFAALGLGSQANALFRRFLGKGLAPNRFVVSSVLNACSASGMVELGVLVHGLVVKSGLGFDPFVEVGLVDVYAKCGVLDGALKVFYEIPVKSCFAWNAMLSGYVHNGGFMEAAELFREMRQIGLAADVVTLRVVANAASYLEMFELCKCIHVHSIKIGLDTDTFITAELVRLPAKLGEVAYMIELFKKVKRPDVSLYSLLISGFHLHGLRAEAVKLLKELLVLDSSPKQGALVSVINLCFLKEEGTQVHAHILKTGYLSRLCVGNALISMYVKFGEFSDAKLTFWGMVVHDVISWTAIMTGLAQNLQFGEALEAFLAMRKTGIQLDQHSVATTVNACMGLQNVVKGKQVHVLGIKLGFEFSKYMTMSLLHMYAKCGYIDSACRLFLFASSLNDVILTNIMLAGYCWNFQPRMALELFTRECRVGMVPDQFSLSTVLGACADVRSLELGEQIHCWVTKSGFENSDVVIGNAVINMYIKSGSMADACKFFYILKRWSTNSFEMLMTGYIQNRCNGEALQLFHQMQQSGIQANPVTFARILRGCADLAAIDLGKQIHAFIIKMGLLSDLTIGSALVGMYAKSKNRDGEKKSANEMPIGDVIQDCHLVKTHEASGTLPLEEVKQNWYSYSHDMDLFPVASNLMCEPFVLSHVVHNGLKFFLLPGKSLSNIQTIHGTSDILLLNTFDGTSVREKGWISSVSKCTPVEFMVMQVGELLPSHVILVAVLSDASQIGLVDEKLTQYSYVQKPWTGVNHSATTIGIVL
ncbi:pentatricopeptide repeat-containing protein-like [Iris pallida]|uniref:Pentatricopeptide repeat-containing protein-like n=1 Tax=Iris pallida TaxID=29817 RepID=A0AAX6HGA7_IRIPA|nr:pentatricopeptide repeat-containing protein-like [Iris pallida]